MAAIFIFLAISGCATASRQSNEMTDAEKEVLLKQRVMAVWIAQVAGDREMMYDFYDPFYRARASKKVFTGKTIPIRYYNPEIASVDIKGNVAKVGVKMEYEIKDIMAPSGKLLSQPLTKTVTKETWLFIDGTWYREYYDPFTESSIADY
jgi:predicted lipid-binding transport protein (Tim44 family)